MHNTRIKSLLNQMEDKVFDGKVKLYNVFKKFDKDCDGYVSHEDFHNCLNSIKVFATQQEVSSMLKLIDITNKGFLNFSEFSKVFTPSMSDKLVSVPQKDDYNENLHPTSQVNKNHLDRHVKMQEAVQDIRKTFYPDVDSKLVAPTRFSSKPNFGSTFVNF